MALGVVVFGTGALWIAAFEHELMDLWSRKLWTPSSVSLVVGEGVSLIPLIAAWRMERKQGVGSKSWVLGSTFGIAIAITLSLGSWFEKRNLSDSIFVALVLGILGVFRWGVGFWWWNRWGKGQIARRR